MPLSQPVNRSLRHRRAITAEAYQREDGLWDIEVRLTDTKPRDIELAGDRIRPQGQPLHDLWLRITIDEAMTVLDAEACSDWVPYPSQCDTIGPAYRKLIGLNLRKGFRKAVRERLGGIHGCSHLTEAAGVLPSTAIQAFAGEVISIRDNGEDDPNPEPPYQLHGCHALRFDGEVVRQFYPRWYGHQPTPKVRAEAAPAVASAPQAQQPAANGDRGGHAIDGNDAVPADRPTGTSG
ncbi:DUF2889 domain-containing protein [Cupriavidus taiwanensis]|uniref:DUF2889 domain-containing protein n=1 Tax=Cupriavidus taiwanensis TaxID=164546 RepID=A0A375BTN4_9BURK|nr:DUF2889 domain-containing protein [Cupriavidus taiwanensis]MDK3026128.1 DUF2889 domain-containing protein [Cupriavidus taiwanensis]NSX16040.1 DUF2889 domain-containing protein [Cupriavidus taiwanensis]SOY53155.1 conserved hypothetical protein [Cupriavidus taiwanensis]